MNKDDLIKGFYKCPICGKDMYSADGSAYCNGEKRHCFDYSSSGYLNLAVRQSAGGDSKEAVRARTSFLEQDYYSPVSERINSILSAVVNGGVIIDAGCGEGYYTNSLAASIADTGVIGFDLSKFAVDHASKTAKRKGLLNTSYAVANIFDLPIKDSCADCLINVFAPCAQDEFSRVLKPGGYLLLCGAGKDHLIDLKKLLYEDVYQNGERQDLPTDESFTLISKEALSYEIKVEGNEMINNLFSMTPYYWRTGEKDKQKLCKAYDLRTLVEVEFYLYQKSTER